MRGRHWPAWCVVGLLVSPGTGAVVASAAEWIRYRSDTFGYELSYPPEVRLQVYFGGQSAEVRDPQTGRTLASLEVWPPDECPRQPSGLVPKALGIERVTSATQADGADGSSWCGAPLTVRERTSTHGVPIFELDLTCKSERLTDTEDGAGASKPVVTTEGTKGPTYFADISVPWRKRILTADPVGIDPRLAPPRQRADPALVLRILETLRTVPTVDPHTICIEDLAPRGVTAVRPAPAPPVTSPARGGPPP